MTEQDPSPVPEEERPQDVEPKPTYDKLEAPLPVSVKRGALKQGESDARPVEDDWFAAGVITTPDGQEAVHVYKSDPDNPGGLIEKAVPMGEHLAVQAERMRAVTQGEGRTAIAAMVTAEAKEQGEGNPFVALWSRGDYDYDKLTPAQQQAMVEGAAVRPEPEDPLTVARRQADAEYNAAQHYASQKANKNYQ